MNDLSPLEAIFFAALDKGSPSERAAYLDEACAADPEMRRRLEKMLAAQAGSFLEQPVAALDTTVDEPAMMEKPGTVIGPYKLLEQIGEGGFGVVFMAEQTQPVRRKVALKVLKPGMDSRQAVARFEAERQALALMDHPNIARVFDGGTTSSGRVYFVMELVRGAPITDFCDQNQLTPRQRLELFVAVCQAVQHAHQKGVIHRDIKPSNVLVTMHDTVPVVKVIDFGVAKAVGQELTDKTLFTGFAQMVGTPLYMSPEQAGQSGLDVDTRSDVYSLGVLLYELLTGSTPFRKERFKKAAFEEIRQIIREEDPPRPSTRLCESRDTLPSISARRQTEPGKLTRLVKGELDWIVMKALEKDRSRRYETANGFALDVQRYLADEPVLACPPSAWYRLRKLARRHKGPALAASLVLLALVVGMAGTTAGMAQATRERDQKDEALRREQLVAYFRLVALVHRELEANSVGRADQLLEECPAHLRGWEWHYLKRLRFGQIPPLEGRGGVVQDVALSPDGRTVASATYHGTVKIWDATTGRLLQSLKGRAERVWCVVFSPDGQRLATGGSVGFPQFVPFSLNALVPAWILLPNYWGEVTVWDVATGRELLRFYDHIPDSFVRLAYSPDGRWLAAGDSDGEVKVWEAHTGQWVRTLSGHTGAVTGLAFSPAGRSLATSSEDQTVRIWDLDTGGEVHNLPGHSDGAKGVAFRPDGQRLASVGLDSKVRVWDVSTGGLVQTLDHPAPTWSVAYSPDGRRLAAGGWDYTVKLWDATTGEEILTLRGHTKLVHRLAFSGDGRRLASGSYDETVRIWDATPLGDKVPLEVSTLRQADCVFALAYSRDGRSLAAATLDRTVRLLDPGTGRTLQTFAGHTRHIFAMAVSPDSRHLASASFDGTAKVWDARTGQTVHTLRHDGEVHGVAYCPAGRRLATASGDGVVKIWDAETGTLVRAYQGRHGITSVAYSPDGQRLAWGDGDGEVTVWDVTTDQECSFSPLRGHSDLVRGLAFSPDGRFISSAGYEGTAKVWDARTGREVHTLRGHKERILAVAFSPDSRRLATAGIDATVKVWDLATGREIHTFQGHAGMVFGLAFRPDGQHMAAGSGLYGKGEIRIWDVTTLGKSTGQPPRDDKK